MSSPLTWSSWELGQTSAYVPAIQKYSGPELKGAKKISAIEEEIPHDDEDEPSSKKVKLSAEASEKKSKSQETSTDVKDTDGGKSVSPGPKRRGRPPKMKIDNSRKVGFVKCCLCWLLGVYYFLIGGLTFNNSRTNIHSCCEIHQ